jgi:hypothetical protein
LTNITRKKEGIETLQINDCPNCNGGVEVWDCGYSSFNPGIAKCLECEIDGKRIKTKSTSLYLKVILSINQVINFIKG